MWKKILMLTGITIVMIPQMSAQTSSSNISIGPLVGYQRSRDADDGKLLGGAALRLKLSDALGGEASINYREEEYANAGVTVRSWPVMVTGLLYPLPMAYGAIGAGWYNSSFEYDRTRFPNASDETQQKFGWHFGAGVEVPPSSSTKLTADIRYVFLNYNFEKIPGSDGLQSDFYVVTVGFLFNLQ
jgi:opacity protein-like surface antigen